MIPFIQIPKGGPNPYAPTDMIDVQYNTFIPRRSFGFNMAASYHDSSMWEHTSPSPNSWIVAHRLAENRFHLEGAVE